MSFMNYSPINSKIVIFNLISFTILSDLQLFQSNFLSINLLFVKQPIAFIYSILEYDLINLQVL
jgi:hypothetical protein